MQPLLGWSDKGKSWYHQGSEASGSQNHRVRGFVEEVGGIGSPVGESIGRRGTLCRATPVFLFLLLLLYCQCLLVLGQKYLEAAAREPGKCSFLRYKVELEGRD